MQNERKAETSEVEDEHKGAIPVKRGQVGTRLVGPLGIILMTVFLIIESIFLLTGMIQFWPSATLDGGVAPVSQSVAIFFWDFTVTNEARLLIIVAMAGALGGLVHALRSLYWYVGNRALVMSWLIMYILLPFAGTTIGLVFYFVIRAGFFSPQATVEQTSAYGFAALAGLVGLFSEQAVLKLKQLSENLLAKPEAGVD